MPAMLQRICDLPDQGLDGVVGVLAVAVLYVIGFVIKGSKNVSVDFVLFSAGVPLITLMVVMLLFGALLGGFLMLLLARRRSTAPECWYLHRRAAPASLRRSRRRWSVRSGSHLFHPGSRLRRLGSQAGGEFAPRPARGGCQPRPGRRWVTPRSPRYAVGKAVHEAVHVEPRPTVPCLLDDRRAARVRDLRDDVETAQQLVAVGLCRRCEQRGVLVRDVLDVTEPGCPFDQAVTPSLEAPRECRRIRGARRSRPPRCRAPRSRSPVSGHRQLRSVCTTSSFATLRCTNTSARIGAGDPCTFAGTRQLSEHPIQR